MFKLLGRTSVLLACVIVAGISATAAYDVINERRTYLSLPLASDTGFAIGSRNARILSSALFAEDAPEANVELTDAMREQLSEETRLALRKEPLNPDGIRALAVVASLEGREDSSFELLKLAERVSRRDAGTSLLLSRAYAQRGELEPVLDTMDRAMRSSVSVRQVMLPQLMSMLTYEQAVPLVLEMLRTDPLWEEDFWAASASQPAALVNVAKVRIARAQDGYVGKANFDRRLLGALIKAQEFAPALQLSLVLGNSRAAQGNAVNNSDFSSPPGLEPFDWELLFSNSMTTDILLKTGQLRIQTFSGGNGVAARQLVALDPGGGVLETRSEGWEDRDGETLYARITCATRRSASINIDVEQAETRIPFSRPSADCRYNWLELLVRPQPDRRENTILLDSVSILPRQVE